MPWRATIVPLLVCGIAMLLYHYDIQSYIGHRSDPAIFVEPQDWDILRHLGGYSPWIQKTSGLSGNRSLDVPEGCIVDQIHMMSRHGERYPTFRPGERMLELYQRLRHTNLTFSGQLSFVNDWDFFAPSPNEQFEQLTSTGPYAGTLQSFSAGVKLRTRYQPLLETALANGQTAFWASDSKRVIESARYFAIGFFGLDWDEFATLHVVPETAKTGGDTLTPGRACPNYARDPRGHNFGVSNLMTFRGSYLPNIIARLHNSYPEILFSEQEIYSMQEMCGFELLAKGHTKWCDVFTREELLSFEYARDVLHYYRAGPGNLFGPSMGWLWLNATASLLLQGPDAGPLFLSFNHDGDIIAMLAALELFPQQPHLPTTHVLEDRTWRMSDVTPMGGRVIIERLVCPAQQTCWDNSKYGYPNHVYCTEQKNNTFIRVNVNDGIVPLPQCRDGPGESCPLEMFLERVRNRSESLPSYAELCGHPEDAPKGIQFLHQ